MSKSTKRSERRHHRARLKKARAMYWFWSPKDPRQLSILARTPSTCACWMCNKPRKIFGKPFSEIAMMRRADHDAKSDCE